MTFFGCATGVLNPLKRMTDMAPKDPTRSGMWVLGSIRYLVGTGVSSVAVPNGTLPRWFHCLVIPDLRVLITTNEKWANAFSFWRWLLKILKSDDFSHGFSFIPSPMNIPTWFGEVFLIWFPPPEGRSRVQQANGTHPSEGTQETPGHKPRVQVTQVIRVAKNIPTVHDSDSLHLPETACIFYWMFSMGA